jgi:hypothetical protein
MEIPEGFQLDWGSATAASGGTVAMVPATVSVGPSPPNDWHYHGPYGLPIRNEAHVTTTHVGPPSVTTSKPPMIEIPLALDVVLTVCALAILAHPLLRPPYRALLRLHRARALAPRPP